MTDSADRARTQVNRAGHRSPHDAGLPRVLVVAVDGVLADTLLVRQAALEEAVLSVGLLHAMPELPVNWIAGRSWSEAIRALPTLLSQRRGNTLEASLHSDNPFADQTLLDLAEHAAESVYAREVAKRTPVLEMSAVEQCVEAVERGWRLILRADSTRRSSDELMRFTEEQTGASRVISGDDPGVLSANSVVLSQYAGIIAIAAGRRTINGVERRVVWERIEGAIGRYVVRGWPQHA